MQDKFINDKTFTDQIEKRQQINLRRDKIEVALRELVWNSYSFKYGKKTKEKIIEVSIKSTKDESWENFDLVNNSRKVGSHSKSLSEEDELMYKYALSYFETALEDFL